MESLRLDHGVLRGVATERANGLLEPVLYARINDAAARAVSVEAPAPLAEGGCVFRFAVPLQPADLVEAGLAVSVHMVGLERADRALRLAPAPVGADAAARVAELEGRLRRLEDAMAAGLEAMEHALRRRMDAQAERVDAFIEASASLLLDRLAASAGGDAPAALRALAGSDAARAAEAAPLRLGNRVELPPGRGPSRLRLALAGARRGGRLPLDGGPRPGGEPGTAPRRWRAWPWRSGISMARPSRRCARASTPCPAMWPWSATAPHRFRVRIAPPGGAGALPDADAGSAGERLAGAGRGERGRAAAVGGGVPAGLRLRGVTRRGRRLPRVDPARLSALSAPERRPGGGADVTRGRGPRGDCRWSRRRRQPRRRSSRRKRGPPSRRRGNLQRFLSLEDFERAARRHLPRMLHGFISGACETDASLRDNREAFAEWGFVPRVLVDTSERSTVTELLGRRYAAPFGIAPMGASALSAYRGDLVFARAAAAAGLPMILSASSLIPLEEVRRGRPDHLVPGLPAGRRRRASSRWWTAWRRRASTPSC